jgi:hypothetical protein
VTSVVMVLKAGGLYAPNHVTRLAKQVRAYAPAGTEIICLTDLGDEVIGRAHLVLKLQHGWPGWFAKIELGRLPGPILYLDLDTTIIGDLTPLLDVAERHDLVACGSFWEPGDPHKINSSVMAWRGDIAAIYDAFARDPERFMQEYSTLEKHGDQAFIADHCPVPIETWQDLLPGHVMSFKLDAFSGKALDECRIVVSHGLPKPWALDGADSWLAARQAA